MGQETLQAFHGQHCETVASGCLLKNLGIELSEPMLFGLGEGLSFIFLNLASLPLPFLGGRVKPFILTEALCKNLQLQLHESQTSSRNRSWRLLESQLAHGTPVGLQLDCFHLDYFTQRVHFAGHCLAALGIDEKTVTVVDTKQQGGLLRIDRSSLEAARFEKGPMSARARSWTITKGEQKPHLGNAVRTAIKNNASSYLAPPFKGASYQGISKLIDSLPDWFEIASDPATDFAQAAMLMERAGTGGSLFRNFYRDFLHEAVSEVPDEAKRLRSAQQLFSESAQLWAETANCLDQCSKTLSTEPLRTATGNCKQIKDLEVSAMTLLAGMS